MRIIKTQKFAQAFPGEDTKNTQVDLDDVFEQGWHAFEDGEMIVNNPYDVDPQAQKVWIKGFNAAQKAFQEKMTNHDTVDFNKEFNGLGEGNDQLV